MEKKSTKLVARIAAVLLAGMMVYSLASCGKDKVSDSAATGGTGTSGAGSASVSSTGSAAASDASTESAVAVTEGNQIDKLLDAYEGFIVKLENAAAKQDTLSLTSLLQSEVDLLEQLEEYEDSDDFTAAQMSRYIDLTARYSKAAGGMDASSIDLSDFGL